MKFKFSFETLLKYKLSLEDIARRDWMEAQRHVDVAMKELDGMYEQVEQARLNSSQIVRQGGAQSADLVLIDEFVKGQGIRIIQARAKIRELMVVSDAKNEVLVDAAKERRKLEKLKEHQYEAFRLDKRKDEAKKLDELVVTRFKKSSESGAA